MNFTFGSDPEFILIKNGCFVSAIDIIKGTKENRIHIKENAFYHDNVMAECSIKPGSSKKEVISNFRSCFKDFAKLVYPAQLETIASAIFPESELQHPTSKIAGCDPEMCVYSLSEQKPPQHIIETTGFRSAGGHVHLGIEDPEGFFPLKSGTLIRLLDVFLGVPSIFMDKDPSSPDRRKIYGLAGRHRLPYYGVEYRSLGNFWLSSPETVGLVHDICKFCINFMYDKMSGQITKSWETMQKLYDEVEAPTEEWLINLTLSHTQSLFKDFPDFNQVQNAINNNNSGDAYQVLDFVKSSMPKKLFDNISSEIDKINRRSFYPEWSINLA